VPLPLYRLLDPRPALQAAKDPIAQAVNIESFDLTARTYELPPKDEELLIADETGAREALELMRLSLRAASITQEYVKGQTELGRLWKPNPFLTEQVEGLRPGRACDLGCGSGRDAVYLAAGGWEVVGVDLLPDAIVMAKTLALRYLTEAARQRATFTALDLRSQQIDGSFDLITSFFFLDRELLDTVWKQLKPGGRLIVEAFTTAHRDKTGKPKEEEKAVEPGELPLLVPQLEVVRFEEGWLRGRHTARLHARRGT
jgi:tellurite methyltransferase